MTVIQSPLTSILRRKALKVLGAASVGLASTRGGSAGGKTLNLGLLPNLTARVLFNQYEPVKQYLVKATGTKVDITSASSWGEFYRRAADNQFDVMVAAPHIARLMQKELGFIPIAGFTPNVEAALICAKGQNVQHLDFIRGKTVVSANPACLITVEGETWLSKQGLQAGSDYINFSVRSADSVGVMIARGDAVAGLMSLCDLNSHPQDVIKNLKIVQVYSVLQSSIISVNPTRSPLNAAAFENVFHDFAQSPFAETFQQRSGSRIQSKVNENIVSSMDRHLTLTRQILNI